MNYPKTKKLVELLNMFLGFVETNLSEGKSISKLIKNVAAAVATKGLNKKELQLNRIDALDKVEIGDYDSSCSI